MYDVISWYNFLLAVNGFQYLQKRRCQMKSIGKTPNRADKGGKKTGDGRYIVKRWSVFNPYPANVEKIVSS